MLKYKLNRRVIFITLSIFLAIISCIMFFMFINIESNIKFTPKRITYVNYNNYDYWSCLDYKYDKFAFIETGLMKSRLTVVDSNNYYKNLNGVKGPFSIYKDKIIYLNKSKLMVANINSSSRSLIESDVFDFIVYQDMIIFNTNYSTKTNMSRNSLYSYDFNSGEKKILYKDVSAYRVYKNKLLIIAEENILKEISLDSFEIKDIMQLNISSYPINFMICKDKIILQDKANSFDIIDLKSKENSVFYISKESYRNNRIVFICDDNSFYYSFQATKTDGSIVINTNSDNNGLWKLDLNTLKNEKILDETFNDLYLFDDLLFGVKNNKIFKINVENGKYKQLK